MNTIKHCHGFSAVLKLLLLLTLTQAFLGCQSPNTSTTSSTTPCTQNRMALDIGSGSTKVLIANVDICHRKIKNIYKKEAVSIKFKEALAHHNNQIPADLTQQASQAILQWKQWAQQQHTQVFLAVATEVFRQAKNGPETLQTISKTTGIEIHLINQTTEADLGFWSAIASTQSSPEEVVVWDIGGGSMQITSLKHAPQNDDSRDDTYDMYRGKLASVSFKDAILKLKTPEIENKKSFNYKQSPNPLGKKISQQAVNLSHKTALEGVPTALKAAIQHKKILGLGGVHFKSVGNSVQKTLALHNAHTPTHTTEASKNFYTQEEVQKALLHYQNLTDAQITSPYPETEVTNLALVLGFMQALGISQVQSVDANLTHGLILFPKPSTFFSN